ncbi:phage tail tube protein [Bavariicoccus seileri]|uniref:phage tail tube protein n=1 Tax=Bavariicoccus seileri TaxID=549685 RepID=UPI0003B3A18B|nr:phage tail tube protein [Bavariicoccus seileri]
MAFLNANDTINGKEGTAFATIDGRNIELFYLKSIEASIELNKSEVPSLGRRMVQNKVTGASGSGSITIYNITSEFAQIAVDYVKTGRIPKIQIKTTNEDPNSTIGRASVLLKGVIPDEIQVAQLDVDSDSLEQDIDFTFDDLDILEKFKAPTAG